MTTADCVDTENASSTAALAHNSETDNSSVRDSKPGAHTVVATLENTLTDQTFAEMDDRMASLALSDPPLESRTTRNLSRSVRGIFPDHTAFTPQSHDQFIFTEQTSATHPSGQTSTSSRHGSIASTGTMDSSFTSQSFNLADTNGYLMRRESYPNLATSFLAQEKDWMYARSSGNYPSVRVNQPLTRHHSPSEHRKYSVDMPYSIANKRLDLLEGGRSPSGRLTPSYSNPDLSAARRLASLEGSSRLREQQRQQQHKPQLPSHHGYPSASLSTYLPDFLLYQESVLGQAQHPPSSGPLPPLLSMSVTSPDTGMLANSIAGAPNGMPSMLHRPGGCQQYSLPVPLQSVNATSTPAADAAAAAASAAATSTPARHAASTTPGAGSGGAIPAAACNNKSTTTNGNPSAHLNPMLLSHFMRPVYHHPQVPSSSPPSPSKNGSVNSSGNGNTQSTQRRHNDQDRFAAMRFEDVLGDMYTMCKDQHGCRFLQKKLEDQKEEQRDAIFMEIFPYFSELMTDPFGNYLCQKLMEYCTDIQRTVLVEQVAQDLVGISLNMHGTRAVQKMIEFITLPEQIDRVVEALAPNVVILIKDLNGNHVIQRCLQRMSFENKQFIYDAVSKHCVEVATHRHGCCVLQRCIDYSAEHQKAQLVAEIIHHALTLVQDPFGNYVVQYVLDLNDTSFSDRLIRRFIGHVSALSIQKFSSNVMEKCIRVAEAETRCFLIEELVHRIRLEKLLRDSYANYVIQTALDYAEPAQRAKLVDCIRPLLPAIRNMPYGKRIYSKVNREQPQRQKPHYYQEHQQHQYNHHSQLLQDPQRMVLPVLSGGPMLNGYLHHQHQWANSTAASDDLVFYAPFQPTTAAFGALPNLFSVFHNH